MKEKRNVGKWKEHSHQLFSITTEPPRLLRCIDAPGFADTNGPEVKIVNAVNMFELMRMSKYGGLSILALESREGSFLARDHQDSDQVVQCYAKWRTHVLQNHDSGRSQERKSRLAELNSDL
ncbi:hypothetical protein GUITHDRAFT_119386 [Guillardia theta CCMP2712]|uniref:Uncharacterized protein n=1 Tax=Guillardia theta (strain CCMP2712) TaxID=905079 RepID=L1IE06_GUITC|nr:hypothetical protein GUITHDRAFT_119386 [Guillardia theta CCMP2712]EKX34463.1 hypothetical protein GUITHDRAFT_119386 [Guillardia theta CCMP2712]|eukprot:XP_005821443.1 hypothetical protein GUITHDRAFT_119386 [Guillardia theta CCMP2712]